MMGHNPRAAYRASSLGRGSDVIIMAHSRPVKPNHKNLFKVAPNG